MPNRRKRHYFATVNVFLSLFFLSVTFQGDAKWHFQLEHYHDILWQISAVSRDVCWVLGVHGTVLRTINTGVTWNAVQNTRIAGMTPTALTAFNADTAILALSTYSPWSIRSFSAKDTSWILRTSDGGRTWHDEFCQPGGFFNGIHRLGTSGAISLGNPVHGQWTILISSNFGKNWSYPGQALPQMGSETGSLGSTAARGDKWIWFGALDERSSKTTSTIYRSTDGGQQWTYSTLPFPNPHTLVFRDSVIGIVSTKQRDIARTTDGGTTWSTVTLPSVEASGDVAASPDGQLWLTQYRSVLSSTDAGKTWTRIWQAHPSQKLVMEFDLVMENDSLYGWATTWAGGIARFESKAVNCLK